VPWKASSPMSERIRFVTRAEEGESIKALAKEFGISEKTAHKYLRRWQAEGVVGLQDRSRAPQRIPHRTSPEVVELILTTRRAHPTWGARKIKQRLAVTHPGVLTPSSFTMQAWMRNAGLITRPRRYRRRGPTMLSGLTQPKEPNDVWATDFKGQFRLGNGQLCYPLTATDLCSRYVLSCEALESTQGAPVWPIFERLFGEYGVPRIIRSDNGAPFASRGLAGLTQLSVKWLQLGIKHERIEPGEPQQNGSHERMHRTLKQETTRPAKANLLQQQERFDAFIDEFNQERPHQALAMQRPADIYRPSLRRYDGLPDMHYPLHDDVRRVESHGILKMPDNRWCHLSLALIGRDVGLREVEDGRWLITFASLDLGYYDEREKVFTEMDDNFNEGSPISPL
jgi:transposase InsO family protein